MANSNFLRRLSIKIHALKDDGNFFRDQGFDFGHTLRQDNIGRKRKHSSSSSIKSSQYLNHSDIKKKAIQIFHTEDSDHHFGAERKRNPWNKWILHPNCRFRSIFDLATVVWVLFLVFFIPFEVGFQWYTPSNLQIIFMDLLDVWFAVDIILNFRTGYIHHGTIIMKPEKIVSNYVTTWFLIDLLGTIPFEKFLIQEAKSRKSLKLFKYFKIPKLMRVSRLMKYIHVHKHVYNIFQIIFLIFTLLHIGACVWINVLDPCEEETNHSFGDDMCDESNIWRAYAEAVHMSAVMMLGVSNIHIIGGGVMLEVMMGPRDGDKSRLYIVSTFFMVGGLFIIALLISEMSVFMIGKYQGSAAFQRRSDRVRHEMEYYGLPDDLQVQVRAYYNYVWIHQKQYDDKIALLSDHQMSTDLQRKLALHLFKDVISHISFFSEVDDILLGEICLSLRTRIFLPNDMIIFKGDVGKELFIIAKGVVEVLRDDLPPRARERSPPILLRNGSFFGEIALVMEVRRTCSVQARTVCEVSVLLQKAFDAILSENPEFARRMNELVVARQLDKHLAKSTSAGVNFQVSKTDLDMAISEVEKNMKEGLQRRMEINGEYVALRPGEGKKRTLSLPNIPKTPVILSPSNCCQQIENTELFNSSQHSNNHRDTVMSCQTLTPGYNDNLETLDSKRSPRNFIQLKRKGSIPKAVSNMFDDITRRSTRFFDTKNSHDDQMQNNLNLEFETMKDKEGDNESRLSTTTPGGSIHIEQRRHSKQHYCKKLSKIWRPEPVKTSQHDVAQSRKTTLWHSCLMKMSDEESNSSLDHASDDAETLRVVGGYSPRHSIVDIKKVRPSILMSRDNQRASMLKWNSSCDQLDRDKKEIKALQARLSLQDEALRKVLSKLEMLNDLKTESKETVKCVPIEKK